MDSEMDAYGGKSTNMYQRDTPLQEQPSYQCLPLQAMSKNLSPERNDGDGCSDGKTTLEDCLVTQEMVWLSVIVVESQIQSSIIDLGDPDYS